MIRVRNLSKSYNIGKENELSVLKKVSLDIHQGEMVAIMGASGAGKSTLLHILGCIETFESGEYSLDDQNLFGIKDRDLSSIRNEKIGYVMQDFALVEEDSALDNVLVPLLFDKTPYASIHKIASDALEKVNISQLSKQRVNKMSGGQKQRVAIARAIVKNPKLLLADEPTGSLDSATSEEIMTLLQQIHETGQTIVIVTHDASIASRCQRVITIADGKIN